MSKLTKKSESFSIANSGRFFCGFEVSEMPTPSSTFVSGSHLSHVLFATLAKGYSDVAGCIVRALSSIDAIKSVRCQSKIAFSVIKSLTGNAMVNLNTLGSIFNHSVHGNSEHLSVNPFTSNGVKAFSFLIPVGAPIPFSQKVIMPRINNGILSLGKRNKANGWIGGLFDGVSTNFYLHNARLA